MNVQYRLLISSHLLLLDRDCNYIAKMIRLSIFAFLSLATINAQSDDQSINQSIGEKAIDAIIAARNTSVNPCENFYEYSCGGWMNNTQLPSDLTRFTRSFNTIEQENDKVLKQVSQTSFVHCVHYRIEPLDQTEQPPHVTT